MIKTKTGNAINVQTLTNSIFIKFADLATALFSELLRTQVKVQVSTVKTMAYKQYSRSISAPSTFAVINMESLQCNAVLETDLIASYTIIGRLCGGIKDTGMDMHEPTEIETSLLEGIIVRLLSVMREAWSRIADINPALRHIETNAMFAQIARPKDKVIISSMEIEIDGVTGKMNFCVPYCTVEALLDRLSGKYIIESNSYVLAKQTGEIRNLNNNFAELKTDICSDISRQFKENKRKEVFPEDYEPDYAAALFKIAEKDIDGIVKLVRVILEKSVGAQKTIDIINRLTSAFQVRPFDFIRRVDPEDLLTLIKEEHPQIIALILSYLTPENAAVILQKFTSVEQIELIKRIEVLKEVNPEVLREIERVLEKKLSSSPCVDYCVSGGIESSKS
jgi:flagellar motor switch protein FliM